MRFDPPKWPLLVLLGMYAGCAEPAPARDADERFVPVIPGGKEEAARDLLAPLLEREHPRLGWSGPRIEIDLIHWWLTSDDQPRGTLILAPRQRAEDGMQVSESFAIGVAWAPEVEPTPDEKAHMDEAIASVIERDAGGFYVLREITTDVPGSLGDVAGPASDEQWIDGDRPPQWDRTPEANPDQVRSQWGWRVAGTALFGLFALGVTLRRWGSTDEPRPDA